MVLLQHHGGHRALRLLIALFGLAACGGEPAPPGREAVGASRAAITNGTATSGDLGVAALVQGDTLVCTATLVAPRVLLTAAHCLPQGSLPEAFFGDAPGGGGGTRLAVLATSVHPAFDPATLANDVAMALLAGDAPPGAMPWPLPPAPLDASSVGMPLRLVGFGQTGPGDTSPPEKRAGTTTLASLTATELTFGPSPSQTCTGDSGGPAFATVGGVEVIVGVTSSGDAQCAGSARDERVDAFASSFIAPWLAATAEGAAAAGDRCFYPANCAADAGECAAALDDASLSFCAPACGDGGACPAGLSCLAGGDGRTLCRHAPPSPGALGAACSIDANCTGGTCVSPASGGPPVCAPQCFPDLPGFCATGYACRAAAGDGGVDACFADTPAPLRAGCAAAPASGRWCGGWLVAVAAAGAGAARRIRCRRASAASRSRTDRGAP